MTNNKTLILCLVTSATVVGVLTMAPSAFASSSEKVLYSFCPVSGCADGNDPQSNIVSDPAGNLYGTTYVGGTYHRGVVFELIRNNGKWTEKVLHTFTPSLKLGRLPNALIRDTAGNLYGTTYQGGIDSCPGYPGCGTVFELTPGANGEWTLTVLHRFNGKNGFEPSFGGLILDHAGNLYGTTEAGGPYSHGTVYELTPNNGRWTEKILYSFCSPSGCAAGFPAGGVIFDGAGNLYGTTEYGGAHNEGTVFQLTPSNGKWTPKLLHSFNRNGTDGAYPVGALTFDKSGSLFGATLYGGTNDYGTAFELTPNNGKWTEKVVHSFNVINGASPVAGLTLSPTGKLYGTTTQGGTHSGGTVFQLILSNGTWAEKVLHNFGMGVDGYGPNSLTPDQAGNLYGTSGGGGAYGRGTVFEITP
jgi:uncharacterized repeat protein (TIGR03803 family)